MCYQCPGEGERLGTVIRVGGEAGIGQGYRLSC